MNMKVTNAGKLSRDVKIEGSLGCSEHALVEFTVLKDTSQTRNLVRTSNFRRTKILPLQGVS